MRIAVAQIHTVAGAFDQTVERMVGQSQRAAEQGAELIVFPLAALAGIDAVPFADRPAYLADAADAVASLARELACPAIVPVPVDLGEARGYFDALLVEAGEVRPLRMAQQVRVDDAAREHEDISEFSLGGVRFALAFSQVDLDVLVDYDYTVDAILFLSGYPFSLDDVSTALGASLEETRFVDDAKATASWLVGVGSVGGYGDQVFSGSSFVLSPEGSLVAIAPAFEEALLTCDIDLTGQELSHAPLPPEVFDAPFSLWQAVSAGIHDYVAYRGKQDVALLLDGSLNASVLLALASDALGPLHVHVLVGASAGKDAPACRALARRLRVDQVEGMGATGSLDARDLDELMLAAFARELDAVVLSSLDKTALALGLGAGHTSAATLCPLGDVYRSDLLDMAHVRNTISPLFRKVSLGDADAFALDVGTEVRPIASERDLMAVDEILLGHVEYDRSLAELVGAGQADEALVDAVLRTHRAAEGWRRAQPPVLAMSTHTLDEARYPLGITWHDTHRDPVTVSERPLAPLADEPSEPQAERSEDSLPASMDLEGTLAMLHDLAEQLGFGPFDVASLRPDDVPPGEAGSDGPPGPVGWMTPFSEN